MNAYQHLNWLIVVACSMGGGGIFPIALTKKRWGNALSAVCLERHWSPIS